jgi:hypothetical protein
MQITAVTASPNDLLVPLKNSICFDIGCKFPVALLMLFFGNANGIPGVGGPVKALFPSNLGETGI